MSNRLLDDPVWRAFAVQPQKEGVAAIILERNGYTAEVPTEIVLRRASRYDKRRTAAQQVMLTGYVFVRLPRNYPWGYLFDFRVIKSIVGFNGRPAVISDTAMQKLLRQPGYAAPHRRSQNTTASFTVGDIVEVPEGAFQGWSSRVKEIRGDKARIVLQMLGAERELDFPIEMLQAA